MSSAPAIGREQLLIGIRTQELLTAANVGYEAAVRGCWMPVLTPTRLVETEIEHCC